MSKNWAVLVAGSLDYQNYRHQADIAHAYQILIQHGFHTDKIITMMYDDVANDPQNPFPGQLYNNYSRVDVYKGVKIDYRDSMVIHNNFLRMMRGDKELKRKGFKVLESTEEDNVFFNFADHGASGLISFPVADSLEASELQELITEMSEKKRFKELLIYIEACESGSMFEGYKMPNNVFATTAANGQESSWACYCDDSDLGTCLGDCYSVNWMHDTDSFSTSDRTVEQQFEAVRTATTQSHVQEFGDKKVAHENLAEFQGHTTWKQKQESLAVLHPPDQLDSRKAHLAHHYQVLKRSNDLTKRRKALHQINLDKMRNAQVEEVIEWIVEASVGKLDSAASQVMTEKIKVNKEFLDGKQYAQCYKSLVKQFANCFSMNKVPMSAKHYYKFRNLCKFSSRINQSLAELKAIVVETCDV
ncbi:hypothetical protein Ciccas_013135 [Cichlidogyrus casuarinus]|uniref:Hemoglobinase n=1 Tax=Cichlidogyrus casuarinus TaxID=1844966 RepID=A0ABD2PMG1_9PLAT